MFKKKKEWLHMRYAGPRMFTPTPFSITEYTNVAQNVGATVNSAAGTVLPIAGTIATGFLAFGIVLRLMRKVAKA